LLNYFRLVVIPNHLRGPDRRRIAETLAVNEIDAGFQLVD